MRIKINLLVAAAFCFVFSSFTNENVLLSYKTNFDNELKDWTATFKNFNLEKFEIASTVKLHDASALNTSDSGFVNYIGLLKPVLYFSDNKQRFVDIYGYELNMEKKDDKIASDNSGEQQIILYDLQKKSERKILFCGISSQIQDVVWQSDAKLILVGRNVETKKIVRPLIYLVDLAKQQITLYRTKDKDCIETSAYTSSKLKNLHYSED
ncbi:hypothetical protein A9P82_00685 [Arachidicoccus ginsenosidimutans]|uniref:hypothetical protein n=1 Tax=Arachidicoccus sp. BS20 TaxID=1850526 RepID=UPI0007F06B85|nr:hypothetical protein [Arachidicoccus sp. BS20]ANI87960.1 hypothetical protein A9P82_00685 [Arachidicoccus sp. BS20]